MPACRTAGLSALRLPTLRLLEIVQPIGRLPGSPKPWIPHEPLPAAL